MMFEIKGIGLPNKGAELMLVAVQQQILAEFPDAKFAAEPYTSFIGRSHHSLYQKFWVRLFGIQWGRLAALVPKKIRTAFGLVTDKEIDVILDASGFAYGDQWGAAKANSRLARDLPRWKKQGKKVILLPQAFGPFTDPALQAHMKTILNYADLVFARDDISYGYMQALGGGNLQQSPDFTNLVKGVIPADFTAHENSVCVIPNSKMIEMTDARTGSRYPAQMAELIEQCQAKGFAPYLLVHEGQKDAELAQQINGLLTQPIAIHSYQSPTEIKGVIGTAHLVISSRFHGLVSALSQGVPAIATGWSHKYEMLMQEYGCSELLLDANNPNLIATLDIGLTDASYQALKQEIAARSDALKQQSKHMWQQVIKAIKA